MNSEMINQDIFASHETVLYYSLGRYALLEALVAVGASKGNRILLPSFLCRDLLAPINIIGAIPVWYEVSADLRPSQPQDAWPNADIVLLINYFGFSQPIDQFLEYSQRTGAIVIEDNTHGYLSCDNNNDFLGFRGDIGLFSIRKTYRLPDGAVLWISNNLSNLQIPRQVAFSGVGLNRYERLKSYLRGLPIVGEIIFRILLRIVRTLKKISIRNIRKNTINDSEYRIPGIVNPWRRLLEEKSRLDKDNANEIKRRRLAYLKMAEAGKRFGVSSVFSDLPEYCAPYGFAFRSEQAAFAKMKSFAKKSGFDTVIWPDLPTEIETDAPDHYRNVFLVNFIW